MRAAGPVRTLFTSLRWGCRFSALTWRRRRWRSPEGRPTSVGWRLSSLRNALHLERLDRMFDTVLDCGLFHTFDGEERSAYVASLTSVTKQEGTLYVLCLSDVGRNIGPHPVSRHELSAAFNSSTGWNLAAVEPDHIQTRFRSGAGAPAWLATIA